MKIDIAKLDLSQFMAHLQHTGNELNAHVESFNERLRAGMPRAANLATSVQPSFGSIRIG